MNSPDRSVLLLAWAGQKRKAAARRIADASRLNAEADAYEEESAKLRAYREAEGYLLEAFPEASSLIPGIYERMGGAVKYLQPWPAIPRGWQMAFNDEARRAWKSDPASFKTSTCKQCATVYAEPGLAELCYLWHRGALPPALPEAPAQTEARPEAPRCECVDIAECDRRFDTGEVACRMLRGKR